MGATARSAAYIYCLFVFGWLFEEDGIVFVYPQYHVDTNHSATPLPPYFAQHTYPDPSTPGDDPAKDREWFVLPK